MDRENTGKLMPAIFAVVPPIRTALACLIAPMLPAMSFATADFIFSRRFKWMFELEDFPFLYDFVKDIGGFNLIFQIEVLFISVFSLPIGYIACFLLATDAIPSFNLKGKLNVIHVSMGGAIFGAIAAYVFGTLLSVAAHFMEMHFEAEWIPGILKLLFGAFLGVFVAFPFSIIAGYPFFPKARHQ